MYKIYLHFNIYKPKHAKRENRSNFQEYSEKMEGIISKRDCLWAVSFYSFNRKKN